MGIIAMSRELGSLGTVIGTAVAKKLGYDYVYQEITGTVARYYEVVEEKLIRVVEKSPRFLEKLRGDFRRYQAFVQAQVFKIAEKDNVVLIGRWSTLLLRGIDHALIVQIVQGREFRATEASQKKLHNLAVASSIRAELKAHRSTREVNVDVQVRNGQVTLMGVVATEAEKRAVERVVGGVKGIERVESHLRVLAHAGR